MVQLNELESLNCQLREQILQQQSQMAKLQRNLEEEESRCQELMIENSRLLQAQADIQNRPIPAAAKPLTLELFEAELDEPEADEATLDDFREISLPNTPTVLDGCSDVFEEHFKVLESLESYLETQHLVVEEVTDESGVSMTTTPSVRDVRGRHRSTDAVSSVIVNRLLVLAERSGVAARGASVATALGEPLTAQHVHGPVGGQGRPVQHHPPADRPAQDKRSPSVTGQNGTSHPPEEQRRQSIGSDRLSAARVVAIISAGASADVLHSRP